MVAVRRRPWAMARYKTRLIDFLKIMMGCLGKLKQPFLLSATSVMLLRAAENPGGYSYETVVNIGFELCHRRLRVCRLKHSAYTSTSILLHCLHEA